MIKTFTIELQQYFLHKSGEKEMFDRVYIEATCASTLIQFFIHWFNNVFILDFPEDQEVLDGLLREQGFENIDKSGIRIIHALPNGECVIHDGTRVTIDQIKLIHQATSGTLYPDKLWDIEITSPN